MSLQHWRVLCLVGLFGLFSALFVSTLWWAPPAEFPRAVILLILALPLMLPMRGVLHGRVRAHVWASLVALPYVLLGIAFMADGSDVWRGLLVTLLSLMLFTGALGFARGKQLANAATNPEQKAN
ncbi:Uncharacterized membrane protein [Ectothiorhodosinus mongolicus]|uniref:Uncharacterized membrane protein n=1 Tax=Ectothiorhodosinus mongolicus TaxID=233100 RepID=A0A1R3VP15_9GAMM|nr:DUF2069 domain-containing protein [Ectothiorhodosinus mongolicus]ULX56581.1 DUF2069 domain-containing protein [Ectothiorhodosinus mongolicus]SIT66402.1 Uncharacterized membrane protein [Ectothiorhodosinus mongolicus]